ncbi:hypothetical protein JCM11251_002958 [Rhodosporidiobolus azoricus]
MPSSRFGVGFLPLAFALVCVFCCLPSARAFGAGNIPSYSFLEGKAFRHGDIEDVLSELIKKSGGILGRGSKFGGLDIKRVYFGNWLRDYSQAMDIAGLSKLSKQTILNLVMALGFLAHGYATGEFEVTDERLGVYLPTEHIDNPKGYAADQPGGDARPYDPRLRPPVDNRELEIDPRTGMKNYIANEQGGWETSSALVRKLIIQCIEYGRRAKNGGREEDRYEAYRLLGTLLHTLEDFTAHSNWCELSLLRLGYSQVFCHVGDACRIQSPAGPCPPLVTGSFGGADFLHSLLGEATDHISEASVSDLQKAMDGARSTARSVDGKSASDTLRKLLFDLPGSSGSNLSREMGDVEDIRSRASNGQLDNLSPQEMHATLFKILTFRDNVVKGIESTIEKIPGLSSLVEKITNSVNAFVFTTLEPMLKPIMGQATTVLGQGSQAVLQSEDQYEVFNNPHASDPTHSFLSKDHFALILNEPAGQVAILILQHTVKAIVKAWEDNGINPHQVASDVLSAFHHPYFYDDSSIIQRQMGEYLKSWIDGQNAEDKRFILAGLTKDAVRNHKNKRKGHESDQEGHGAHGSYNSILMPQGVGAFAQQHIPGASSAMNTFNSVSDQFSSVQQQFNSATSGHGFGGGHQGGRREFGDEPQGGGYGGMPPMGGPPQAVHGGAPSFDGLGGGYGSNGNGGSFSGGGGGYGSNDNQGSFSGGGGGGGYNAGYQSSEPSYGGGGGGGFPGGGHHGGGGHHSSFGGPGGNDGGYNAYSSGGGPGGYGQPPMHHQGGFGGPPPQGPPGGFDSGYAGGPPPHQPPHHQPPHHPQYGQGPPGGGYGGGGGGGGYGSQGGYQGGGGNYY